MKNVKDLILKFVDIALLFVFIYLIVRILIMLDDAKIF